MPVVTKRVGPEFDSLRLMVQPYRDHMVWGLMRINHNGPTTRQGRLASGTLRIRTDDLSGLTARHILELVLAALPPAQPVSAPPSGAMGEQLTLDLDLRL